MTEPYDFPQFSPAGCICEYVLYYVHGSLQEFTIICG